MFYELIVQNLNRCFYFVCSQEGTPSSCPRYPLVTWSCYYFCPWSCPGEIIPYPLEKMGGGGVAPPQTEPGTGQRYPPPQLAYNRWVSHLPRQNQGQDMGYPPPPPGQDQEQDGGEGYPHSGTGYALASEMFSVAPPPLVCPGRGAYEIRNAVFIHPQGVQMLISITFLPLVMVKCPLWWLTRLCHQL